MKAVIVDDELPARRRMIRLLQATPDVEVIAEASDAATLLKLLPTVAADVVFLDIRMPGLDGLELARTGGLPAVVFTTAFAEYAVDAFAVHAVDYLVKPVRADRLLVALDHVRERLASRGDVARLLRSIAQVAPATELPVRVTATHRGETRIFEARTITRFWAADKYTCFLIDGREYETAEALTALESRLGGVGFVRAHRSDLINLAQVRAMRREPGGLVLELSDGQEVGVSRRHAMTVRARLRI
jgi:DNA-binding LytR/AlgR family response regulator